MGGFLLYVQNMLKENESKEIKPRVSELLVCAFVLCLA